MASGSVVVHDIDSLESFKRVLHSKRDDLENLYEIMRAETVNQEDNWQDPQYDYLKDLVITYCSVCNTQLKDLDDSINYINGLIAKLRDL